MLSCTQPYVLPLLLLPLLLVVLVLFEPHALWLHCSTPPELPDYLCRAAVRQQGRA
jgi:hypothetical protein